MNDLIPTGGGQLAAVDSPIGWVLAGLESKHTEHGATGDELDYIKKLCGIKPHCFLAPDEWLGSDEFLPFEKRAGAYQKLEGVYAFCGVDSNFPADSALKGIDFLYIGKATRLRSRMNEHRRAGLYDKFFDWCAEHDRLLMVAFWLSDERNTLESKLIKELQPIFNQAQNP